MANEPNQSDIRHPASGIILYGAGGHAAVLKEVLEAQGHTVAGLFSSQAPARAWGNIPYLGPYDPTIDPELPIILAMGDNATRRDLAQIVRHGYATAVHPSVLFSPSARMGEGSVAYHGSIVQASAVIGRHAIINTGATVDHDTIIGDFAHIAPGTNICGGAQVGEGTLIGVGARILPGIKIGAWAVVGAGSIVLRDVADGEKVVGVVN